MQTKEFEIALSTFENLRGRFPTLSMNLDTRPAHGDIAMSSAAATISWICCCDAKKRCLRLRCGGTTPSMTLSVTQPHAFAVDHMLPRVTHIEKMSDFERDYPW